VGGWLNDLKDGEGSMYTRIPPAACGFLKSSLPLILWYLLRYWLSLRQHYTGGWGEGRQHGVGTHVWATEEGDASPFQMYNRYEGALLLLLAGSCCLLSAPPTPFRPLTSRRPALAGEFAAGARSGTGIFHYASGAVYAGGWAADLKQGDGLYTGEDGTIVKVIT